MVLKFVCKQVFIHLLWVCCQCYLYTWPISVTKVSGKNNVAKFFSFTFLDWLKFKIFMEKGSFIIRIGILKKKMYLPLCRWFQTCIFRVWNNNENSVIWWYIKTSFRLKTLLNHISITVIFLRYFKHCIFKESCLLR